MNITPMLPPGALAKLLAPPPDEPRYVAIARRKPAGRGKKALASEPTEGPDPDGPAYGEAAMDPDHLLVARKPRTARARRDASEITPTGTSTDPDDGGGEAPPDERPKPRKDPGPCPVRPVGTNDGIYYFFDSLGQLCALAAQSLGQAPQILALFGGLAGAEWLRNRFPNFDKDGNWTKGFVVRDCNAWLLDECTRAGLFDPDKLPIRGHGVWVAQGITAIHIGATVIFEHADGQEQRPAGFRDRGALWPAKPELPPPAKPMNAETAQQIERMFGKWH
jgi:hypothetical protein